MLIRMRIQLNNLSADSDPDRGPCTRWIKVIVVQRQLNQKGSLMFFFFSDPNKLMIFDHLYVIAHKLWWARNSFRVFREKRNCGKKLSGISRNFVSYINHTVVWGFFRNADPDLWHWGNHLKFFRHFLVGPDLGEEFEVRLEKGKTLQVKLLTPGLEVSQAAQALL